MDQVENLFVPDPPAGDRSYQIANTRFVQSAAGSAVASGLVIAGLSVLGNASTGNAAAAAITDSAGNQLLVSNPANTTVLWSSVSSLIDNAIGSSHGAILYRNAASWVPLAAAATGNVLTTQGSAANPLWAGGMTLLNTLTPSSVATVGDTTSFTAAYRNYLITFANLCPATQSVALWMRVATSGSTFISTSYLLNLAGGQSQNLSAIFLTLNNRVATNSLYGVNGNAWLFNAGSSVSLKSVVSNVSYLDSANNTGINLDAAAGLQQTATSPITGVEIQFSTGVIATGVIEIWGLN